MMKFINSKKSRTKLIFLRYKNSKILTCELIHISIIIPELYADFFWEYEMSIAYFL